jgi:predicted small secreted protein
MYRKIITALVLLVTLLAIVACETETGIAKDILGAEPDYQVSAAQLVSEYERSENDANDKYKEKVILVTGVVKEVYRGFLYTPYVDLEAGVRCSFSDEEDADLLGLVTGQTVSMKGRGDRLLFGVELRGCTVE